MNNPQIHLLLNRIAELRERTDDQEAHITILAAKADHYKARTEAAETERDALRDKVDLALDIPMRVYFEGSVSPAEAEWHRGWNDAVTALHDAINPELADDDPDEGDAAMGGADA